MRFTRRSSIDMMRSQPTLTGRGDLPLNCDEAATFVDYRQALTSCPVRNAAEHYWRASAPGEIKHG